MVETATSFRQRTGDVEVSWPVDRVLRSGKSEFQEYLLWRSAELGVCTAIDGDLQSTEIDCPTYHEALVQPAMLLHPAPRRVLILGGGEGATARQVLRHRTVEKVTMVDIDRTFVEICRREMPHFSRGAFDDERLEVRFEDALETASRRGGPYDVILGDLPDRTEEVAPGRSFHGVDLYRALRAELSPGGLLATQAGPLGLLDHRGHRQIRARLSAAFGPAHSYRTIVDSFFEAWSWILSARDTLPGLGDLEATFTHRLAQRKIELEHFDAPSLAAAFRLDKRIRRLLEDGGERSGADLLP